MKLDPKETTSPSILVIAKLKMYNILKPVTAKFLPSLLERRTIHTVHGRAHTSSLSSVLEVYG